MALIDQSASEFAQVVFKLMPSTKVILIEDIPINDDTSSSADAMPGVFML